MYERFTDRARKTMQIANQQAQKMNHEYIGSEHVLSGLINMDSGAAKEIFNILEVDTEHVLNEINRVAHAGPDMVTMGRLPQTPRVKLVINHAIEQAKEMNHEVIGTGHVLLGLLLEKDSIAGTILSNIGMTVELVKDNVEVIKTEPLETAPIETAPVKLNINESYYKQFSSRKLAEMYSEAVIGQDFQLAAHITSELDSRKNLSENYMKARRTLASVSNTITNCLAKPDGDVFEVVKRIKEAVNGID